MAERRKVGELFEELVETVARLRGENGCPWDREQTRESLKPLMLEELYEAFDAIDRQDEGALREELGDMLLHIVFHAQIGQERGTFTIADVLTHIIAKMRKRHPHVFGEEEVRDVDEVLLNWEKIKEQERKKGGMLASLPKSLPALLRAFSMQARVARVGFDWKHVEDVAKKVEEEWREFQEAWQANEAKRLEEEWGDLVFALVNLARHLGIQPEDALQRTCDRFAERFAFVEENLKALGKSVAEASLEEMDALWEKAKKGPLKPS
ncbi:MAG: nucleoside triphosphate pyrophosphohydrolase [Candidatus Caldatribacterium sp.]|uniref:nucleoside triphosphate pyrophosphohydrolase n=1 Tax=Candidatus Caldatribacterium sp. TaxID=2282143 RepID=UPI00299BD557|nr:nucleoside triphosphate pyrophosphohydrolase [Candidatus Caldatribacterium sp.]MCX7731150.1 nucleoside triphosphate pyrophosphohydrolase [Candidatus Caldatribacterium sp.]MDW8081304.1 nucleoside triphosphate pyrophosphohydrolase [Candidatus Calescibacterium sp.]